MQEGRKRLNKSSAEHIPRALYVDMVSLYFTAVQTITGKRLGQHVYTDLKKQLGERGHCKGENVMVTCPANSLLRSRTRQVQ